MRGGREGCHPFSLASAHLSLLQSGLPVEGRDMGIESWAPKPALQLLTPPSSPPQKKNGSCSTRVVIANLALLLPDRVQHPPHPTPRQISLRGRCLCFPAAPHPSLATDDRLGPGADVWQVTGLMAEEGRGQRPANSQWWEGILGRLWIHCSWAAPQITAPGGGMRPKAIHP